MLYVTERCVFRLTPDGLELIEIAPGIDLEKDVLAHVGFTPIIDREPKLIDERLFRDQPMGLKDDLLTVPLDARFAYDADRNIFFINMEAMSVSTPAEAEAIVAEIEKRLTAVGKKVPVVVNYDNFYLAPDLADTYTSAVRSLAERYLTASPATPPAHLCASNSAAISTRADWPHSYTKAARKHLTGCRAPTRDPTQRDEEQDVSVYRVTEVIGVSDESWEAAARNAVETAAGTVRELRIAEVVRQDVTIESVRVHTAYRVRLALSFKYESTGN